MFLFSFCFVFYFVFVGFGGPGGGFGAPGGGFSDDRSSGKAPTATKIKQPPPGAPKPPPGPSKPTKTKQTNKTATKQKHCLPRSL